MLKRKYRIIIALSFSFLLILSISIFLIWFLLGTKNLPVSAGSEKRKVVLYTSMQENQLDLIKREFEDTFPDIELSYFHAGSGKIFTKISAEMQSDSLEADLLWIADPLSYDRLIEEHMIEPYKSIYCEDIPLQFKDMQYLLTPTRLLVMVFAYNTHLLEKSAIPQSWAELPGFKGLILSDPVSSGSSLTSLKMLVENPEFGWSYLEKLKQGGTQLCSGSGATAYQVGEGKALLAVIPDNVALMAKQLGQSIDFVYPQDTTIAWASPIALLAKGNHKKEAKIFIDFMLSDEGQRILYSAGVSPIRGPLAPKIPLQETVTKESEISKNEFMIHFDNIFLTK
ncbi:ABC-type Fe3+ transport system, periplasmic component [Sphaerochaeta pleomorpha str. Grapes]|uniref:ABC-type Fe3+ transport system, periplasmic component n=1 Tax=Sphaerochaeta pleomorpha (strain ATCC BAA-1885 / DSM 22778 / Grapes) TaxID=158190 RepID=G8QTZ1_SPHPG|nr:extracellular solute-binding protein [Sphaerochaeta pleomorpha]AEV29167.1 ABC-type Fe3+ transport system, periplasmic component [Sphaerochaeta pleomorpha str. Grapes]